MARHAAVAIDCAAATEADVCLVQLLLAARRSAAQDGRRLVLTRPVGEVLHATLRRGGFLPDDPGHHPLPDPSGSEAAFWHGEETGP
jgi:hypothetical protein